MNRLWEMWKQINELEKQGKEEETKKLYKEYMLLCKKFSPVFSGIGEIGAADASDSDLEELFKEFPTEGKFIVTASLKSPTRYFLRGLERKYATHKEIDSGGERLGGGQWELKENRTVLEFDGSSDRYGETNEEGKNAIISMISLLEERFPHLTLIIVYGRTFLPTEEIGRGKDNASEKLGSGVK